MKTGSLKKIYPLTAERWNDFEKLFGKRGACGGCWCMSWRLKRSDFEKNKGDANRSAMKSIVESGKTPGLIAYINEEPVGWCAIAPREEYPALERSRIFAKVDTRPVWSITCFFIAKTHRNKGLTGELIKAAIKYASSQGAEIIEAYPFDYKGKRLPDAFVWTGLCETFKKAGFKEAVRRSAKRPIMRYYLK